MMGFNKNGFYAKKSPNRTIFAEKTGFFFQDNYNLPFLFINDHFGGKNEQQNSGSS